MEFASFALRGEPAVLDNKLGLAEDLGFLSRMPELCDVTFLVGEKKEPVGAVRAILATRSRYFVFCFFVFVFFVVVVIMQMITYTPVFIRNVWYYR